MPKSAWKLGRSSSSSSSSIIVLLRIQTERDTTVLVGQRQFVQFGPRPGLFQNPMVSGIRGHRWYGYWLSHGHHGQHGGCRILDGNGTIHMKAGIPHFIGRRCHDKAGSQTTPIVVKHHVTFFVVVVVLVVVVITHKKVDTHLATNLFGQGATTRVSSKIYQKTGRSIGEVVTVVKHPPCLPTRLESRTCHKTHGQGRGGG
mmetsp:Transcript_446/g.1015  ORF Transcript_446/g.1015 Transcript_446/m.1015 type:complete len:201 (-) Transcript_446:289-891(-)